MATNLVLGIFGLLIATVTLVVRYVLPAPARTVRNPYPDPIREGAFALFAFALVPMMAGTTFLAAWWIDTDPPVAYAPAVRSAPSVASDSAQVAVASDDVDDPDPVERDQTSDDRKGAAPAR